MAVDYVTEKLSFVFYDANNVKIFERVIDINPTNSPPAFSIGDAVQLIAGTESASGKVRYVEHTLQDSPTQLQHGLTIQCGEATIK